MELIYSAYKSWGTWCRLILKHSCSRNKQRIALMNDVKMSWYEMKTRWKDQAGSITEIAVREKPRWLQFKVERKCERGEILIFFRKTAVERSEIQEPEVGEEKVEWWAEWRSKEWREIVSQDWCKVKEWSVGQLFSPEVTEGRSSVIRDEERVERWGVSERRERR